MSAHSIFQRTSWDITDGDHRVWCSCGQMFRSDSSAGASLAWRRHRDEKRSSGEVHQ